MEREGVATNPNKEVFVAHLEDPNDLDTALLPASHHTLSQRPVSALSAGVCSWAGSTDIEKNEGRFDGSLRRYLREAM